ncbi:MAG TPA: DoxX family protein [Woeseiaceae bacterium]|nr:DoxX family protein [Woeseiaceae bacterium]
MRRLRGVVRLPGALKVSRASSSVVFLTPLRRHGDLALLLLRLLVGAFLVWGVSDNIADAGHMREFEQFLARFGFPVPAFSARLSVWAQAAVGIAFIFGLLTRWAGIVCIVNFVVAIVMVDIHGGIRTAFPSACLVAIGLYLATHGAGRFSVDRLLES